MKIQSQSINLANKRLKYAISFKSLFSKNGKISFEQLKINTKE
jgi:hypothetical protein